MSITRPLSRIVSITSARPLGLGRAAYPPPERCCVTVMCVAFPGGGSFGRSGHARLFPLEHVPADVGAVAAERLGDGRLVAPGEVADAPVELLQRVLGGGAVPVHL